MIYILAGFLCLCLQSDGTHKLDDVARSICSSKAEFDANHPDIILLGSRRTQIELW